MKPGKSWSHQGKRQKGKETNRGRSAQATQGHIYPYVSLVLLFFAFLAVGCAVGRPQLDKALLADTGSAARNAGVAERYVVGCPDVLAVAIDGQAELSGQRVIGLDGSIDLGPCGRLRVEGWTTPEVASRVAARVAVPSSKVNVAVAEHQSQQIYLFGEVSGLQRAVPYQGPETVLDLLQRVGGITPGASSNNTYVIRTQVAEGQSPEVFRIDLQAILLKQDQRTNIRLQPFDQVYVGESRRSSLAKCIPPCFRTLYKAVCGLYRRDDKVTR